jgi:hypothetical protein
LKREKEEKEKEVKEKVKIIELQKNIEKEMNEIKEK